MLGVSSVCSDAPATAAPSATEANESGGRGLSSGGILLSDEEKLRIEDGDRSSGGNRWPRQETLALLKIRSDMDVVFRDSSLKGPLWEEVSRKLAELGYQRSAKKCKEKFENVYKYHRRTKEGRSTKPDGKTYRFFDQLEALENQPPPIPSLPPPPPPRPQIQQPTAAIPVAAAAPPAMPRTNPPPTVQPISTVPSAAPNPITVPQNTLAQTSINPTNPSSQSQSNLLPTAPLPPTSSSSVPMTITAANPISISYNFATIPSCPHPNMSTMNFASISTSSSTSSDEEPERRCKRKRKWGDFFQRLMSEVIDKQEEMQRKFLETLEKRERDRVAREEAWRVQEMARMNREHELLVQERSVAAAKDAAVIAFLQKISDQEIPNIAQMQMHFKDNPISLPSVPVQPPAPPQPQPQPVVVLQPPAQAQAQPPAAQQQQQQPVQTLVKRLENPKLDNGGENFGPSSNSSSRWPKAEVQALIRLRTNMDNKYQENGPKGPLWEEISAAMRKIGYDRSAKRCKEKWENINKYFKKVKESNKKRPEDSKTCPYFHQLDALYKEKAKTDNNSSNNISTFNHGFSVKPENPMVPIMVQPEQQWPLQQEQHHHHHGQESEMEGNDSDNFDDDDDDGDDEDGDDEVSGYEIVTNKPASVGTVNE